MAQFKFLKGNYSGLNSVAITEGQVLIAKDTREMYVDVDASTRIKIGDFTVVADIAALEALDATAVPTSRLYYVENGNILARSNGTTWIQINKQPTADELKTLLGLGSMAYLSEVSESNLSAELAEKVNAASEGNHSHANKTVLDGITAEKVTAWDAAEGNAKTYADGLNTAMDTRVKAVEGTSHTHSNKALLDTYTQTEENLADAVAKKHEHANKTELDKIASGDKAKWDAVVADHLTAADKAALEDSISDVNTAVANEATTARAAEKANADAITAIKDGTTIDSFADVETALAGKQAAGDYATKAEAQTMADAKDTAIAEAKKAGTDAQDALDAYKTSNDAALAGVKATAEAAVTDADLATALEPYAKTADVSATYETKTVVAEVKATAEKGVADAATAQAAADKAQEEVDALETYVGTIPTDYTETNVISYINKKAEETLAAAQGGSSETAASVKQQLDNYKSENDTRVAAAEAAIDAIEADYLKKADKEELQGNIDAKVASVTAGDASVTVGGTATAPTVAAKVSADADNALTLADDGLKVVIPTAAEYSIVKAADSGDYAAVYNLTKDGTIVGASINIPKDMVVKSGSVVGDEIVLVLNDEAATEIKIPVASLIEYVTSGSAAGDMVIVNVSDDHKVTATITDGTITLAKLTTEVQTAIGKAHSHENATVLDGITADKVSAWDSAQANAEATAATALASARTEITAEIDADVKALADGQVATNKADIEALTKTVADNAAASNKAVEDLAATVYTQEQVDALLEQSQQWGEF